MANQSIRIFISYRHEDSRDFVEKLFSWFLKRYDNVFVDFASIPLFADFDRYIRHKIAECDAFVSVIGPDWFEILKARQQSPQPDWVLIEMEEAVRLDKVIAPILAEHAILPASWQVPDSIAPIFRLHFAALPDIHAIIHQSEALFIQIENEVERRRGSPAQVNEAMYDMIKLVSAGSFDTLAAVEQVKQADRREDWAEALNWIALLKTYGQNIPSEYGLDEREAKYRARLREAQAEQDRRDRADYIYQFVRNMIALGDPREQVLKALERVWEIVPGYDPDGIAAAPSSFLETRVHVPQVESAEKRAPASSGSLGSSGSFALSGSAAPHTPTTSHPRTVGVPVLPPVPVMLPEPFEWCFVPAAAVVLKHDAGSYVPEGGLVMTVEPYFISMFPITNGQYQAFVKADDGYRVAAWWDYALAAQHWRTEHPKASKNPHKGDDLPRTLISWYDAVAYGRWLGAQIGHAVLLPTEAQWQLAAQGTDGRLYPWGNEDPTPDRLNFKDYHGKPVSVQQHPGGASPFGVLDMSGNVQEWCLTAWHDGSDNIAAGDAVRVLRGGSWRDTTITARTTFRMKLRPSAEKDSIGFRVVALGRY